MRGPKYFYGIRLFGLPEEQIRYYDELMPEQKERCHYLFGKAGADKYIYAIKRDGDFVLNRERRRPDFDSLEE